MGTDLEQHGFAAVILAGGTGRRLGDVDKASLVVGGSTLLVRALSAVNGAEQIVVVGPDRNVAAPAYHARPEVRFTREAPPGGGPAAGLLAGRDALGPDVVWIVVLAVDMPGVTAATIERLLSACAVSSSASDGAFLHGPDGRRQLAGVVSAKAIDRVRPPAASTSGLPMHRLLDPLDLTSVAAVATESLDVDTWEDLQEHD